MGDTSERRSSSWDIRNAPRNYVSLVIYQAGSAVLSFGAVWLITRYLGSEGYGGIVAIIAASQIAQVLVNWTNTGVVRFGVEEFVETEKIARVFWLRSFILLANLLLVLAFSSLWFPLLSTWLKLSPDSFWLVIAHFAVTAFWLHAQMSLQAAKLMRTQGLLQMIERLLIFAGILCFLAATRLTPSAAMLCYIAGPALSILLSLGILKKYVLTRLTIDAAFIWRFIAFSLPLFPFSIIAYLSGGYINSVFVANFLSTRELGIFAVATQISGIVLQLPTVANTLLLPLFVSLHKEKASQRLNNYFRHILPSLTMLWGLGSTVLSMVAYITIPKVFGEEFGGASLPLWILLTASVSSVPVLIGYASVSNAVGATHISLYAATAAATFNLIGNFLLIPRLGIAGASWATLLAYIASAATFAVLNRRTVGVPISWTPAAILPSLAGLAAALLDYPGLSVVVCLSLTFLVAYFTRDSISQTSQFLRILSARGDERL